MDDLPPKHDAEAIAALVEGAPDAPQPHGSGEPDFATLADEMPEPDLADEDRRSAELDAEVLARCAAEPQNDTGNGQRMLHWFRHDMLHTREVGWHWWNGRFWQLTGGDEAVTRAAQKTAERIALEARFLAMTPSERDAVEAARESRRIKKADRGEAEHQLVAAADAAEAALAKRQRARRAFAVSSGNSSRIAGMIAQALPHCTYAPEDLDADPLLLAVENGTLRFAREIDLECPDPGITRTRLKVEFGPHDRVHRITKLAPVTYEPAATCPRFDAFIARCQPDVSLRRFLQVYHGYALTGLMGEQVVVFHHGGGANGKSTFIEAVCALMGPYADLLNSESLTGQGQRRGDQATPDFARLPGVRLLRVSELPRGEPLKEALVKSLTGGEPMLARHLNKGFFKFVPNFKAAMSGNDLPTIGGVDHGIWRRIRLLPWSYTFTDAEMRPMGEILAEFAAERGGILNWLLEGLAAYFSEGLVTPAGVLSATSAYREEMDPIGAFAGDCVEREPDCSVTAREMYEAFVSWCMANAVRPWKETAFGRAFPQKGFIKTDERVRRYLDVRLHDVPLRPAEPRSPSGGHPPDY